MAKTGMNELERDQSAQARVAGLVDSSHAASTKERHKLIALPAQQRLGNS